MNAPALPCGCTRRIVPTLEETLACPARWTYRPGAGWVHADRGGPDQALRDLILAALAEAVASRRADIGFCHDCARAADGLCGDHGDLSADADDYQAAYQRVTGIGSDGALLALTRRRWPAWPTQ